MFLGILFALGAALSSGVEKVLRRSVLIREDSASYTFLFQLFGAALALPAFIALYQAPSRPEAWLLVLLSGGIWAVQGLLMFKAYTHLEASVASPISRIKLFFVLLLAVVFLKETLTASKILGTALIFIGVIIINRKKSEHKSEDRQKGVALVLASSVLLAAVLLVDKASTHYFTAATYTMPIYLTSALLLTPLAIRRRKHVQNIVRKSLLPTILTSLLSVGFYYCILNAYKHAEASVIIPITELSTMVAVIGGIIFLKERRDIPRKIIATAILILGAIIISGKII